ncbi:DUF1697 domain-containing protein [Fodinibacter luteus]|uniref:DUF1697 domain-containing protein n=1 Tax=Fodinibacter luteus TaxID=552064 RepID=A0ABP8KFS4_9MICO
MPSYVAFLRAVNVGGRVVRMDGVRAALEDAGFTDVATHIQSGNVFVRSGRRSTAAVAAEVSKVLGAFAGFDVPAIVRTPAQVRAALSAADGIPPMLEPGARRYLAFADGPVPDDAATTLDAWDRPGERARVLGSEVLAELTIGFHRTTLTNARIERITGRTTTWRDLTVVRAIDDRWGA